MSCYRNNVVFTSLLRFVYTLKTKYAGCLKQIPANSGALLKTFLYRLCKHRHSNWTADLEYATQSLLVYEVRSLRIELKLHYIRAFELKNQNYLYCNNKLQASKQLI